MRRFLSCFWPALVAFLALALTFPAWGFAPARLLHLLGAALFLVVSVWGFRLFFLGFHRPTQG